MNIRLNTVNTVNLLLALQSKAITETLTKRKRWFYLTYR